MYPWFTNSRPAWLICSPNCCSSFFSESLLELCNLFFFIFADTSFILADTSFFFLVSLVNTACYSNCSLSNCTLKKRGIQCLQKNRFDKIFRRSQIEELLYMTYGSININFTRLKKCLVICCFNVHCKQSWQLLQSSLVNQRWYNIDVIHEANSWKEVNYVKDI